MRSNLTYTSSLLLSALALGVAADFLFYSRNPGISAPIFVALCLLALGIFSRLEGRAPTRANLWLGAAAFGFACCLALRETLLLSILNILACWGLLLLQVGSFRERPLSRQPGWQYLLQPLLALGELSLRPAPALFQSMKNLPLQSDQIRRFFPIIRGIVLAVPVVGTFTLLLMAADSVFASYVMQFTDLSWLFDVDTLIPHGIFIAGMSWVCAGALLVALRDPMPVVRNEAELPSEGETQRLVAPARRLISLGPVEALTVLVLVNGLFASFMLIQGAYFFGGLDTLERTGMTYSEYARRGFFELLAVACLALGLLWLLAQITHREVRWQRLAFNSGNAAMILLVIGLLGSAFQRMWLYEQAYGFTHLRIYTHSFMIWLVLLLLLFLVALLRERPRLFSFWGFVSVLLYLGVLNIANPDALIVRANIARSQANTGGIAPGMFVEAGPYRANYTLDARYLATLSFDAVPELVAVLPTLNPESQAIIRAGLERDRLQLEQIDTRSGWPGWHIARAQAHSALVSAGIEAASPRDSLP